MNTTMTTDASTQILPTPQRYTHADCWTDDHVNGSTTWADNGVRCKHGGETWSTGVGERTFATLLSCKNPGEE